MSAAMPTPQYCYRAALVHQTDGDTYTLRIDLGCFVAIVRTIRALGINTPADFGATAEAGKAAAAFGAAWFAAAGSDPWPLVVQTELDKAEKYGRLLARVYRVSDGACLNTDLIAAGLAVPYDGHGTRT